MNTFKPFLHFISLLALAIVSSAVPLCALSQGEIGEYVRFSTESVLYLVVKTGYVGTTSNVSITLGDNEGHTVKIPNLVDWDINPLTPPGHIYFQAGQLDILAGPVTFDKFTSKACSINITITGTGSSPGWYPDQIEMISNASEETLSSFHEGIGVCEQLMGIPIPLSYTRLTSRFLVLWHLTLPVILWDDCNYIVIPATFISAASLFCIEEVGVLIEEPFPMLALDELCKAVNESIREAIGIQELVRAQLLNKRKGHCSEHSINGRPLDSVL